MTRVRLEPAATRSPVKHSTIEPLRSINFSEYGIKSCERYAWKRKVLKENSYNNTYKNAKPTSLCNNDCETLGFEGFINDLDPKLVYKSKIKISRFSRFYYGSGPLTDVQIQLTQKHETTWTH